MQSRTWERHALAGAAWLLAAACPTAALAQAYPTRAITMIVPFAPGGPSDTLARLTSEHLGRTLGQQIVVENVGGAGGVVGTERASRATPDGYSIFQHHGALPASMALYANLKYDARTAFEHVGLINTGPMVLTSRKTLDVKDARALFDWLKAQGDKATVAHAGVGSNSYMCALLVMQLTGAKPSLVPYRGTGPAMNDLVSGQVDVLCDQAITATPQVQGGTIKGYAVTSPERLVAIKDVPTYKEAGLAGFDMTVWNAMYAPKGTPKPIVDALHAALQKFIEDPKIVERFTAIGYAPFPKEMRTQEAHQRFLAAEVDRYVAMIKAAGVKAVDAK